MFLTSIPSGRARPKEEETEPASRHPELARDLLFGFVGLANRRRSTVCFLGFGKARSNIGLNPLQRVSLYSPAIHRRGSAGGRGRPGSPVECSPGGFHVLARRGSTWRYVR